MAEVPTYHYHFPRRKAGSFGSSRAGKVCEWLTVTWFRLDVFLTWIVLVMTIIVVPPPPDLPRIAMLLMSPLIAVVLRVSLYLFGWIVYFVPVLNVISALVRVA